jgi:hypothetical protein
VTSLPAWLVAASGIVQADWASEIPAPASGEPRVLPFQQCPRHPDAVRGRPGVPACLCSSHLITATRSILVGFRRSQALRVASSQWIALPCVSALPVPVAWAAGLVLHAPLDPALLACCAEG